MMMRILNASNHKRLSGLLVLLLMLPVICSATEKLSSTSRQMAPAFTLPLLTMAGKKASLSQQNGKVIYLDFWASWCGPCQQSLPLLNKMRKQLQSKYGKNRFEVLAVNLDEQPQDGRDFLARYPVTYPVLSDPKGATPEKYNLQGMPTAFMIDAQGRIAKVHTGFRKSDMAEIQQQLTTLIKEEKP
jgi:thiol-disulfide isomerase/thioredoxin